MSTRFPEWIRRKWASGQNFTMTKEVIEKLQLHTVCQSAQCPNLGECWSRRTATFMVLGNTCTRSCRYCSVDGGKPEALDAEEPRHVAEAVAAMELRHAVITSVTRDDLTDGGADHIGQVIEAVHALNPETTVEILVPDFKGDRDAIARVLAAKPEVFSHNIETVERIYPIIRSKRFGYRQALDVLRIATELAPQAIVKSALMAGHGETADEVRATLLDLLEAGCSAVNIGQYLQPTKKQREVHEYVHPSQFQAYQELAYTLGFEFAVAGPFVRSSYRSEEMMDARFARDRVLAGRRTET
ncbi:MAG: lipoyl synthase [Candidatus Hydrogenedentes bacterium]|nr:lipoyl synthase [Candidatus Hydrogenedentota bacterium]